MTQDLVLQGELYGHVAIATFSLEIPVAFSPLMPGVAAGYFFLRPRQSLHSPASDRLASPDSVVTLIDFQSGESYPPCRVSGASRANALGVTEDEQKKSRMTLDNQNRYIIIISCRVGVYVA